MMSACVWRGSQSRWAGPGVLAAVPSTLGLSSHAHSPRLLADPWSPATTPHRTQSPNTRTTPQDTSGSGTPLATQGEARGRNGKGNLINHFHSQHFPHSIIFKLNNLSLGVKGKFPLCTALPGLTKPTLWVLQRARLLGAGPQCPLLCQHSQQPPPLHVVEALAGSHSSASLGPCGLPGTQVGQGAALGEQGDHQEKLGAPKAVQEDPGRQQAGQLACFSLRVPSEPVAGRTRGCTQHTGSPPKAFWSS